MTQELLIRLAQFALQNFVSQLTLEQVIAFRALAGW
jgi:hypothetical protein